MHYNRTELITLAGIICILALGIVLVAPRFARRLGSEPAAGAPLTIDLDTEETTQGAMRDLGAGTEPVQAGQHSADSSPTIYVYVTGAVTTPGVVELPRGARLFEALEKAGGALETGAVRFINLALELQDGQMVYVPTLSELETGETSEGLPLGQILGCVPGGAASETGMGGTSSTDGVATINVNTAGYQELQSVPGIGPALARRIMTYRQEAGGFKSVEELKQVSGIGSATLEELRPYITTR